MPSNRALYLFGVGALFVAVALSLPLLGWLALALDILVVLGIGVDIVLSRRTLLVAQREVPPLLAQGERASIKVSLFLTGPRTVRLRVREALHPSLASESRHERLEVRPGELTEWSYSLCPRRRGRVEWGPLTVRILGPLGLAWSQRDLLEPSKVRVYPRVRWDGKVGKLLALAHRRELGQSPTQRQGDGAEPYALRAYRPGDSRRKIHWRASARHGRLILREDTWEQGARLVILLDCGRSMASTDNDRSKLDHSLATALALLRVATGRGDRVTLIAYSDRIERRIRVAPGTAGIRQAYAELFDLPARLAESAHEEAVETALRLEPRRALAVLCTSVTDLAATERLQTTVRRLQKRHRTLLVNLEDPKVAARARSQPKLPEEAFAKVAAMEIQLANRRLGRHLGRAGVRTVTTAADQLTIETLDAYLTSV